MNTRQASVDSRPHLLKHPGVLCLIVAIAACAPFIPALDGEFLWDDPLIIGRLAGMTSVWQAFASDLFGVGTGDVALNGATYWRPIVSLSMLLELKLAPVSPEFLMHAVSIGWHVVSSVLVFRALRRWLGNESDLSLWACALAAAFWAVLPQKAENVAWISGRADPMGTAILLASVELAGRSRSRTISAVFACLGTATSLLTKEAMVVAPLFFAMEAWSTSHSSRRAWRAPSVIASGGLAIAYLVVRLTVVRLGGANAEAFAAIPVSDKFLLPFETLGHAFAALLMPWQVGVLKGPYSFSGARLVHEPFMAAFGATGLVVAGLAAWKLTWTRWPALLTLGCLLPVSNLVPNALESRMSDRFLYLPTVGLALALALGLSRPLAPAGRAALNAFAAGACLVLGVTTFSRSGRFGRAADLWAWERAHGSGAVAIYINAAWAAEKDGDFVLARDMCLEAEGRQQKYGYGSGIEMALQAARLHSTWAGGTDRAFLDAHTRILEALVADRAERVQLVFPVWGPRTIDTGSREALDIATRQRAALRRELLVRKARHGELAAADELKQLASSCTRCPGAIVDAVLAQLAKPDPSAARALLARLPDGLPIKGELAATAAMQERAMGGGACGTAIGKAQALFLGEAYEAACHAAGARAPTGACGDPVRLACALSGTMGPALVPALDGQPLQRWNVDRTARESLVEKAQMGSQI